MAKSTRNRRVLDRSVIVQAAVTIADQEDMAALTVRRLAQELGVPPMTLYGYMAGKDEILDAMADSIMGSYRLPDISPTANARDAFIAVTTSFTALLRAHPSVARLLTMRVTDSPDALDGAMEKILDRFIVVGMPPELAVRAYGAMMHYALGTVLYQVPRPWGDGSAAMEAARSKRTAFYLSLDPVRFPRLHELADELPVLPGPQQFDSVLAAIADGLGLDGLPAPDAARGSIHKKSALEG
jgi:AcrR family transcriptional regulator